MHWAGKFWAAYLNWLGKNRLGLLWGAIEEARGISTESFETVSTTKKGFLALVFEPAGSRRWLDGHATDGIDCVIVRVRYLFALNRIHLNEFHYAVIAMELKLAWS